MWFIEAIKRTWRGLRNWVDSIPPHPIIRRLGGNVRYKRHTWRRPVNITKYREKCVSINEFVIKKNKSW